MIPYFQRDGVTLYHADWRDVVHEPPQEVLTDPPYGINYRSGHNTGYRTHRPGWDDCRRPENFRPIAGDDAPFDPSFWIAAERVALFGGNYFADRLPAAKCWVVWDKKLGQPDQQADCEFVWTNFDRPARIFAHLWRGICRAGEENVACAPKLHPHQKPVAVLRRILEYGCYAGPVYDPFAGSGSTLCAAMDLGLSAVGAEIDERYCEVAARRLEQREVMLPGVFA